MNDVQKFLSSMILEGYKPNNIYHHIMEDNEMNELNLKDLKDTVSFMTSPDHKDRFRAEYYQTKIRYDKLHKMTIKYEAGTLDFTPNCSLDLLKTQKKAMGEYLHALEVRAEIEKIDL